MAECSLRVASGDLGHHSDPRRLGRVVPAQEPRAGSPESIRAATPVP